MGDVVIGDLAALRIRGETGSLLDHRGRVLVTNDPLRSRAPRFTLNGCAEGNNLLLRHDLSDELADELLRLAQDEAPLMSRDSEPVHLKKYVELLEPTGPIEKVDFVSGYFFPADLATQVQVDLVRSGTPQGDELIARFERDGVPQGLFEMGFHDVGEFWEPWCVAFHDREAAAIGFAARLGPRGAATGVTTVVAHRGRGLAAAAVAGWASHPDLSDRLLFYSHNRDNRSSQRVTERLGLRFVGMTVAIY